MADDVLSVRLHQNAVQVSVGNIVKGLKDFEEDISKESYSLAVRTAVSANKVALHTPFLTTRYKSGGDHLDVVSTTVTLAGSLTNFSKWKHTYHGSWRREKRVITKGIHKGEIKYVNIFRNYGTDDYGNQITKRKGAYKSWKKGRLIDRGGRNLVGFAKGENSPSLKVAYFTAYPVNLYERDSMVRGHVRKGIHIFENPSKLPSVVLGQTDKNINRFKKNIEAKIAERGFGQ